MKRFLSALCAMLVALTVEAGARRDYTCDIRRDNPPLKLTTTAGTTPLWRFWIRENGAAVNTLTGWTAILYYATTDTAGAGMVITNVTRGKDYFDFRLTSSQTAMPGTYFAQFALYGPTNVVEEWWRGTLLVDDGGVTGPWTPLAWNFTNTYNEGEVDALLAAFSNALDAVAWAGETDPVYTASVAAAITQGATQRWETAYGWGNHATGGYTTAAGILAVSNRVSILETNAETDTFGSVAARGATATTGIILPRITVTNADSGLGGIRIRATGGDPSDLSEIRANTTAAYVYDLPEKDGIFATISDTAPGTNAQARAASLEGRTNVWNAASTTALGAYTYATQAQATANVAMTNEPAFFAWSNANQGKVSAALTNESDTLATVAARGATVNGGLIMGRVTITNGDSSLGGIRIRATGGDPSDLSEIRANTGSAHVYDLPDQDGTFAMLSDAAAGTNAQARVAIVEGRTNVWNTGATTASAAYLAATSAQAVAAVALTNEHTFRAWSNANQGKVTAALTNESDTINTVVGRDSVLSAPELTMDGCDLLMQGADITVDSLSRIYLNRTNYPDSNLQAISKTNFYQMWQGQGGFPLPPPLPPSAETDPVFGASAASGISATDTSNWTAAHGWGNHALAGYGSAAGLTSHTGALGVAVHGLGTAATSPVTAFLSSTGTATLSMLSTGRVEQGAFAAALAIRDANIAAVSNSAVTLNTGKVSIGVWQGSNATIAAQALDAQARVGVVETGKVSLGTWQGSNATLAAAQAADAANIAILSTSKVGMAAFSATNGDQWTAINLRPLTTAWLSSNATIAAQALSAQADASVTLTGRVSIADWQASNALLGTWIAYATNLTGIHSTGMVTRGSWQGSNATLAAWATNNNVIAGKLDQSWTQGVAKAGAPWRLFYVNSATQAVELPLGADGQYLMARGTNAVPVWSQPTAVVTNFDLSRITIPAPTNMGVILANGSTYYQGTPADILTILKTVDGSGSDLDAAFLQGFGPAAFQDSLQTAADRGSVVTQPVTVCDVVISNGAVWIAGNRAVTNASASGVPTLQQVANEGASASNEVTLGAVYLSQIPAAPALSQVPAWSNVLDAVTDGVSPYETNAIAASRLSGITSNQIDPTTDAAYRSGGSGSGVPAPETNMPYLFLASSYGTMYWQSGYPPPIGSMTNKVTFLGAPTNQYWTVPAGVTTVVVKCWGAGGGHSGGAGYGSSGGFSYDLLQVPTGMVLTIQAGTTAYGTTNGGWPNGGCSKAGGNGYAGGGGWSAVLSVTGGVTNIFTAAGGGGGTGYNGYNSASTGGGLSGGQGTYSTPGTQTSGGTNGGAFMVGGLAAVTGGGGGGGYYGGGGSTQSGGTGSGGSGYVSAYGYTIRGNNSTDDDWVSNWGAYNNNGAVVIRW